MTSEVPKPVSTKLLEQVEDIVRLCQRAEQHWTDEQIREDCLHDLAGYLEVLDAGASEELSHLRRLLPLVKQDISLQQFFALIVPAERLHVKLRGHVQSRIVTGDRDSAATPPLPLTVILDNIRSAFNVGSILRSCEALQVAEVFLCGYTATPDHADSSRAAMGAAEHVAWNWRPRAVEVIGELQKRQIATWALETAVSATDLFTTGIPSPAAILVGNEHHGISPELLDQCAGILRIPVFGHKNSLNVANAFSIAGYEFMRKWRSPSSSPAEDGQ